MLRAATSCSRSCITAAQDHQKQAIMRPTPLPMPVLIHQCHPIPLTSPCLLSCPHTYQLHLLFKGMLCLPPPIATGTRGTHAQRDASQPRRDHRHELTLVESYSPALRHFMTYRNAQSYPSGHCFSREELESITADELYR